MFEFLAHALAFFYDIWPSFGGAIILFTLAIMLLLTPLSIKTTRSMIAMQRVGPELKKLQAKYKDDRETLNREMMAFYQENNINPFASCLPMLLQMPVFFVLYQVLIGLRRRGEDGFFNPKYLENDDSALATALRATKQMMSFGIDLSQSMMDALDEGVVKGLPFIILVGLVVLTAYIQQRQIQGRNVNSASSPQQQMIGKIMPFIFIPISISIPAGVVIYFVVSNTVRIGQQALVTRLEFGDKAEAKRNAAPAKGDKGRDGKVIDTTGTEKKATKPVQKNGNGAGAGQPARSTSGTSRASGANRSSGPNRAGATSQSRSRKKKKRK